MNPLTIFIVEDDTWYGEVLQYHLALNPEYKVELFKCGKDCIDNLHKNPSIITLDYSLPDISGHEILKKIKSHNPDVPVIIVSGQEDISVAIDLLKEGAYDYIVKNKDTKDRLWNTIKNARENFELKEELNQLKVEIGSKYKFESSIKGNSSSMKKVFNLMEKATKTQITVSITGETGTGKELVAKAIHYNSLKKDKPFIAVNVAAIPRELIESELFGYEKGAFTGAISRRIGKFEEANKGSIFLDEIGEMDLNLQTKLLRVLQEKEITRIGGNNTVQIDTRVIVATHKNLADEVKKGNFREDLYYRLLGLPIQLPPLREREKDILILAKFFLKEFCQENNLPLLEITGIAQKKLLDYPFPGNVRELKAIIELAAVMSNNELIDGEDISFNTTSSMSDFMLKEATLKDYTKNIIKHFLDKYDNNVLLVAQKLDVGKSTIYRMIKNNELVL